MHQGGLTKQTMEKILFSIFKKNFIYVCDKPTLCIFSLFFLSLSLAPSLPPLSSQFFPIFSLSLSSSPSSLRFSPPLPIYSLLSASVSLSLSLSSLRVLRRLINRPIPPFRLIDGWALGPNHPPPPGGWAYTHTQTLTPADTLTHERNSFGASYIYGPYHNIVAAPDIEGNVLSGRHFKYAFNNQTWEGWLEILFWENSRIQNSWNKYNESDPKDGLL